MDGVTGCQSKQQGFNKLCRPPTGHFEGFCILYARGKRTTRDHECPGCREALRRIFGAVADMDENQAMEIDTKAVEDTKAEEDTKPEQDADATQGIDIERAASDDADPPDVELLAYAFVTRPRMSPSVKRISLPSMLATTLAAGAFSI